MSIENKMINSKSNKHNNMKKRGELTTQQIVVLIVLLISFAVILVLILRLDFGKETKAEICHNSVVNKASSVLPTANTPLKCYTEYVCITKDGTCEELSNPEVVKVRNSEEIYETLAQEMANCWWMFGEGKLSYYSGSVLTSKNYCSICSQIYFDDSLAGEVNDKNERVGEIEFNKDGLYTYFEKTKLPGNDKNYLEYFTGMRTIATLKANINFDTFGEVKTGEQYYILMGIVYKDYLHTGVIGDIYSLAFKWNIIQLEIGLRIVGGPYSYLTYLIKDKIEDKIELGAIVVNGPEEKIKFITPSLVEVGSDQFKAFRCSEVVTFS